MEIKIKRNNDDESSLSQPAAPQPGPAPLAAPDAGRAKLSLKKSAESPAPPAPESKPPVPAASPQPPKMAGSPGRINLKAVPSVPAAPPAGKTSPAPAAPAAGKTSPAPAAPAASKPAPISSGTASKNHGDSSPEKKGDSAGKTSAVVWKAAIAAIILAVLGGAGYHFYPALAAGLKKPAQTPSVAPSAPPPSVSVGEKPEPPPPVLNDECPHCKKKFAYRGSEAVLEKVKMFYAKIGTYANLNDAAGYEVRTETRPREELDRECAAKLEAELRRLEPEMFRLYKVGDELKAAKDGVVFRGPIAEIEPLKNQRDASIYGVQINDSQSGLTKILYRQMSRDIRAHFKPYNESYRAQFLKPGSGKLYRREHAELEERIRKEIFSGAGYNFYDGKFMTRAELDEALRNKVDQLCHRRFEEAVKGAGFMLEGDVWYSAAEWAAHRPEKSPESAEKASPRSGAAPTAGASLPPPPSAPAVAADRTFVGVPEKKLKDTGPKEDGLERAARRAGLKKPIGQ